MKIAFTIVLVLLTLLAISSGVAKVALMQQDVEFFGKFGLSNPILIAFGAAQVIGGVLLPFRKTRFIGAAIVAITFLVSLVLLLLDGNIPLGLVTLVMTLLASVIMKQSWRNAPQQDEQMQ